MPLTERLLDETRDGNVGFWVKNKSTTRFVVGASRLDCVPASRAIARPNVISIAGHFLRPTITGFISELTDLSAALMCPTVALRFAGFAGFAGLAGRVLVTKS